jgi:GGDEF domain-containing protein
LEAHKAVRLQYCFSLLWLQFDAERAEPEGLSGVTETCAALALSRLRATDVMTLLAPTSLGILCVDAEPGAIPRMVERLTENLATGTRTANPSRVSWSAGAVCYPRDGSEAETLLELAEQRMTRARIEGGNRLYVGQD